MKVSSQTRRKLLLAGLSGLAAQLGAAGAAAQDAARVMPRAYPVVLQHDRVRVLEFTSRPGMGICGEGVHSHPAHLTVVITDWQGVASTPGTGERPRRGEVGDVLWSGGSTHKVENTGKTNARVLIVELKTPGKAKG